MTDNRPHAVECPGGTDRYAELAVETGLVIYDRNNHRAWLQSSGPVQLTDTL